MQRLARDGWLGFEHDSFALFSFTGKLWDGLGPALVVAVLGLVLALRRRSRPDLILAVFVLVYFADLLTFRAHFDRYVLPLVPPLAVLAGRQRLLAPLTLGLLVVPLVWAIGDDVRLTRTDTRAVAHGWIVAHVPPGATDRRRVVGAAARRLPVVGLALPGPGRPFDPRPQRGASTGRGRRLRVVTGAVADRVLAARDRYPREARFYADLRMRAKRVYHVQPGHGPDRALGLRLSPVKKAAPPASRSSPWPSPGAAARPRRRSPGSSTVEVSAAAARSCPKAWQASWQRLANRIHAPCTARAGCPTRSPA